jgi:ubiquinone/menaquinone biosynthesis C-methylase UbiE
MVHGAASAAYRDIVRPMDRIAMNRKGWNYRSRNYQRAIMRAGAYRGLAWGPNQYPEDELKVLGALKGKKVLEIGCGAAQFGIELAKRGARVTGIDLSAEQLRHARANVKAAGVDYTVVRGNAENLSRFRTGTFDIVTSDFARGFMDLDRLLPEVRRVLKPGGFCAFSWSSPIIDCMTWGGSPPLHAFVRNYFDREPFVEGGKDPTYEFKRTYGDWVRAFARAGLVLEDLIEPQTPKGGTHTDWPQYRWQRTNVTPGTCIWKARKPRNRARRA